MVETGLNRVVVFDAVGKFKCTIGDSIDPTTDAPLLLDPTGITLSLDASKLYVADTGHNNIKVFDTRTGEYMKCIGFGYGKGPGRLCKPTNIAVSLLGDLYVSDTLNSRVQVPFLHNTTVQCTL